MSTIGVRQLRDHLSQYLRRVKTGERLIITERGESVAILSPPARTAADQRATAMVREGLAEWAGGKPRGSRRPARIRGRTMADTIIEGRR